MNRVKERGDANTVVGEPIHTPEGVTIIPVSRISVGFGSGGSDFASKKENASKNFGGGTAAGVNVDPIAFLIVRKDTVRLLPCMSGPYGPVEKLVDMMPEFVDRVTGFVDQRWPVKEESAAEKETKAEDRE
jgi:sporulation protein YtfJ